MIEYPYSILIEYPCSISLVTSFSPPQHKQSLVSFFPRAGPAGNPNKNPTCSREGTQFELLLSFPTSFFPPGGGAPLEPHRLTTRPRGDIKLGSTARPAALGVCWPSLRPNLRLQSLEQAFSA